MLKDKLTGRYSATLRKVELHEVQSSEKKCEESVVKYKDEISWNISPSNLKVAFTRVVAFEPEKLFWVEVSYYITHELIGENALEEVSSEEIKAEICADLSYYLQEQHGFMARVSHIIANLTSSFGGTPIILPPALPQEQDLNEA